MKLDPLMVLKEVTKRYGSIEVLSRITLTIHKGECIIIRGSNGSGKSTLLKIAAGLLPIHSGARTVKAAQLVIGYAPDHLPKLRMTSTEYLTHMGRLSRLPKQELQEKITRLHALFNLEQSTSLKMPHFSKGMLQKLNLMQATLHNPDVLVLDEPLSGLDNASTQHLLSALQQIQQAGTAIVAVVHDPLLAEQLESRTYWLKQGHLEAESQSTSVSTSTSILTPTPMSTSTSSIAATASQAMQGTVFELVCQLSQQQHIHLANLFSDVIWHGIEGQNQATCIMMQKDYDAFMTELLRMGIQLISLQRKELV